MGTNQSKKKKRVSSTKDDIRSNGKKEEIESEDKSVSGASTSSSTSANIGKLQTQSTNVSSSQANFFKMLDEKIENGIEFDEAAEEEERKRNMLRCVEEWDHVLGRSHDDYEEDSSKINSATANTHDSDFHSEDAFSPAVRVPKGQNDDNGFTYAGSDTHAGNDTFGGSVDSMRTMFSNSVKIPAGTFREEINEAISPPVFPRKVTSPVDEVQIKSTRPNSAAIGGRRKIRTPPDSLPGARRRDGDDCEDTGFLNCSIRLSTVLQDREAATASKAAEAQSCK